MFGKKPLAKKIETSIGVDIGAFAVKIVQVTKKPEGFYLDGLGYAKIDPSAGIELTTLRKLILDSLMAV